MSKPENETENKTLPVFNPADGSLRAPVAQANLPRTADDQPPTEGASPDLPLSSPD